MMEYIIIIIALLFLLVGLIGCIIPFIPGPPLAYIALMILQFREEPAFSLNFMLIWLFIVLLVSILDYAVPLIGTKQMGGSKYGMWGCSLGLIAGLWWPPLGIIIGPFLGAFIGELMANQQSDKALKAALGSFLGFAAGTLLKLITCFVMTYYIIVSL